MTVSLGTEWPVEAEGWHRGWDWTGGEKARVFSEGCEGEMAHKLARGVGGFSSCPESAALRWVGNCL